MKLTWEDFLKLASIVTNLDDSIRKKQNHQRVAEAANEYRNFFKDSKYVDFMKIVRISLRYK